jgi:hypothetical protein
MEKFKSQPYQKFLYSHTRLNNFIKVSTVAVDFLYKSKTDLKELSEHINELILKAGERWTPRIIKNIEIEVTQLKNDLSKTGIIWVYSAFDVFFKQVEGQLSGFFPKSSEDRNDCKEDDLEEKKETKIISLYTKLGWSLDNINGILPVLKFYEVLRHCVAHNMGHPTEKLVELSKSEDFQSVIRNWETKYIKRTISDPPIVTNETLELKPHHCIMYSETCLRIATDINNRLFEKFGLNHFIGLTIKTHLIEPSKLKKPACENFSRYIVYHLKQDFDILISPYDKIYEYYSDDKLKKQHKSRYLTLKNIS